MKRLCVVVLALGVFAGPLRGAEQAPAVRLRQMNDSPFSLDSLNGAGKITTPGLQAPPIQKLPAPVELKAPQMQKVFGAFAAMLYRHAEKFQAWDNFLRNNSQP